MQKISTHDLEVLNHEGSRFTLFIDPRYTIYGELKLTHLFLHCSPISEWNRKTYLSMLEAILTIKEVAAAHGRKDIWAFVPIRKQKFISMMGFITVNTFDTNDGPYVLGVQPTETK